MQAGELYNLQAAREPRTSVVPDERDRALARWVGEVLAARPPLANKTQIVELGCGSGALSYALAELPRVQVHGVDIARASIERAQAGVAAYGGDLRFSVLDLDNEQQQLADASADVLVSIDVLEHVFDVFNFMQHVSRIIRPGGILLLRVPNVAYIRHRLSLARGKLPITSSWFGPPGDLTAWRTTYGWDGGHLHFFTQETLGRLLRDHGLRPLDWRDPGTRFDRIRRLAPGLLAGNLAVLAERS